MIQFVDFGSGSNEIITNNTDDLDERIVEKSPKNVDDSNERIHIIFFAIAVISFIVILFTIIAYLI